MALIQYPTCTPEVVLNTSPCIDCASESDLMRVMFYLLAYIMFEEGNIQEVITEAKCWTCVSDKQKMEALITSLAANFRTLNANDVLQQLQCLRCRPDAEIKAGFVYLWCRFWNVVLNLN